MARILKGERMIIEPFNSAQAQAVMTGDKVLLRVNLEQPLAF
jgi:hypothetical protein